MFSTGAQFEPTFAVTSRFSFLQLLLLICYVSLESSLPARIRDIRQLSDVSSRNEHEWYPQIGTEGFSEMRTKIWTATSTETRRHWEYVRDYLLQEKLVHFGVSAQELRAYLCHLLCRIEQISSESLIAMCTPRAALTAPITHLGERASLVLVCFSLGVTLTPGDPTPLLSLLTHPDEQRIGTMVSQLQTSPLFRSQIRPPQLWDALSSLQMLFAYENEEILDCGSAFDNPSYGQPWTVEIQQHEIRTWQYNYFRPKSTTSSSVQHHAKRPKRNAQSMLALGGFQMHPVSKRRKQLSSDDNA
ncbi:uncharacterized protein N7473_004311 [Penicillium subrubescens]|uniref:Uncharacterized protein n=1 Tax=Penicillium subrubescens TaxID=1316194 RepID=A0A1Q5UDD4_9EURO|nr:uncharacterized protein N7473_004311 [Penicillium subrubescens]KAJ5900241.1 hypothetical protein N7473_004311 [Penicillium subrubescens]OKP10485.1 hypothetical protein PENSUB_4090 [Penicillium subrubescens]